MAQPAPRKRENANEKRLAKALEEKLSKARRKQKPAEMIEILESLETVRPREPRYPHLLGDAQMAVGNTRRAADAYERAAIKYADRGFIARSMAMAKTLLGVDPSRTHILGRIAPDNSALLEEKRRELPLSHAHEEEDDPFETIQPATAQAPPPSTPPARPASTPRTASTARQQPPASPPPAAPAPASARGPSQPSAREGRAPVVQTPAPPSPPVATPVTSPRKKDRELKCDFGVELSSVDLDINAPNPAANDQEPPSVDHLALLPLFPLFSEIPQSAVVSLATKSKLQRVNDGKHIIRTGDPANGLYGIVEGSVRVLVPGREGGPDIVLGEGHVFGESYLLTLAPRTASVVARGELVTLFFPRAVLDELARTHPDVNRVLLTMLSKRLVANLLMTSALFAAFDVDTRLEISKLFRIRRAAPASIVFESQSEERGLCIPLTGLMRVISSDISSPPRHVGPGSVVGQETLVGIQLAQYRVAAATDLLFLYLPASRFGTLAAHYPPFLDSLASMIPTPDLTT